MSIKAIPTKYKGIEYRSRTEARWAVFFDSLNVQFEYEREGYQLSNCWYVPDFWLPRSKCWIEIKGEHQVDEHEHSKHCEKLAEVCIGTNSYGVVFAGPPSTNTGTLIALMCLEDEINKDFYNYWACEKLNAFVEWSECGQISFAIRDSFDSWLHGYRDAYLVRYDNKPESLMLESHKFKIGDFVTVQDYYYDSDDDDGSDFIGDYVLRAIKSATEWNFWK